MSTCYIDLLTRYIEFGNRWEKGVCLWNTLDLDLLMSAESTGVKFD